MSLRQQIEWTYAVGEAEVPTLRVTCVGAHDVGRLLHLLCKGNVEHGALAVEAGRALNTTKRGRGVLDYLIGHGGANLYPDTCDPCRDNDHGKCWHEPDDYVCACYEFADHGQRG